MTHSGHENSISDDSVFASQSLAVHTKDSVGIPLVSIQFVDYESTLKKVVNRYGMMIRH